MVRAHYSRDFIIDEMVNSQRMVVREAVAAAGAAASVTAPVKV